MHVVSQQVFSTGYTTRWGNDLALVTSVIIIIIIAPLTIVSEDQWGELECIYKYKACQSARTDGGLFTDTA